MKLSKESGCAQTHAMRGAANAEGYTVVAPERRTTPAEAARCDVPTISSDGRRFSQVRGVVEPGGQRGRASFKGGGRRHKRSNRRADDVENMKRRRAARRLAVLQGAVTALASTGEPTHEAIAKLTGIPIGFLLWAYPTNDSLLAIASPASLSTVTQVQIG
jgi:hypothetical protein